MAIDDYISSRAEYVRLDREVDAMASAITEVGQALIRHRATFSFSNTGIGMPPEVVMGRGAISANGDDWPSAKKIMETLAAWHKARSRLRQEWSALDRDQQAALQPPPASVTQ